MKKKLLAVVLIIVLVFALVGCGNEETPEYNYFQDIYSSLENETDIRLETIIYQQLQTMFKTPGKYLVFFGGESDGVSKNVVKDVNDAAIKYKVPVVYNFDPNLDGGIGEANGYKTNFGGGLTYNADLTDTDLANVSSKFALIAYEIRCVLGGMDEDENPTPIAKVPTGQLVYIYTSKAFEADAAGKLPEYYSVSATISESTKDSIEATMQKACIRVPSAKDNKSDKGERFVSDITPIDYFSDARLHIGSGNLLEDSGSVFEIITYHQFIKMLDKTSGVQGDWFVHFGGAWCPNTQAMAWLCDKWAKDYGVDKIYLFDPRIDGGVTVLAKYAGGTDTAINLNIRTNDVMSDSANATRDFSYTGLYANLLLEMSGGQFQSAWNYPPDSGNWEIKVSSNNTFDYVAKGGVWAKNENGTEVANSLPRMCVPNIMLLNNINGTNKIIASIECEYTYSQTSDDSKEATIALKEALTKLFEQCSYAFYNPIVEEAASSGGGSAPVAESPDC